MNREKSLLKNTIIIMLGKVFTQLITFFLLPIYTGVLSTEEYGIVDLLNTLISLMLPIVTFQVEKALFRELIEVRNDESKKVCIISNSFYSVVAQCILYLIVFCVIFSFINNDYRFFLATNVIAYIFSSLFLQIARGFGNNEKYATGSFISALATIIFNIIFLLFLKLGVTGMLLGSLMGHISCIIYLFFSLKLYNYIRLKVINNKVVKKLWTYSIPLIPNAISWWIFSASDRVIVSNFLGLSSTGILSAASKFSAVYINLYNIFDMSWTESISLHINDIDIKEYFNKMFNVIINMFISLAAVIISFMPFIYPIMINRKFSEGYNLVPILIIASIFNVVVGLISTIYVAKKNTKAIANTSIISAIINIFVHLLLINYVNLYAAAISTLVSFFTMSVYRIFDIKKKYFNIKIKKSILLSSVIIFSIILISYYSKNVYFNIITILISLSYTLILNKKSFGLILDMLKNKIVK